MIAKPAQEVVMPHYEPVLSLVGRLLLAAIFLSSRVNKLLDPQGTQQYTEAMGMVLATAPFYAGAVCSAGS